MNVCHLQSQTHHNAAVHHRDVLKRLHAERPTAPLALLRRSAQRGRAIETDSPRSILTFRGDTVEGDDDADLRDGGLS